MANPRGGPAYMNSSPVMTMVLQPGMVPKHDSRYAIPREVRLWDRTQRKPSQTVKRPPKPSVRQPVKPIKPVAPIEPPMASPVSNLADAACNTVRRVPVSVPTPPPAKSKNNQTQTPRKRFQDRPATAPEKKRPNPLLGESGYNYDYGGSHSRPLRPPTAGIPNYTSYDKKHFLDLYRKKKVVKKVNKAVKNYKIRVETGDKKSCGTEARVYLTLFGAKGKSTKKRLFKYCGNAKQQSDLVPFKFSPSSAHTFSIDYKNVGILEKILVEHDGYEESDSWFLNSISLSPADSPETYIFNCQKWLSLYKADCQISRELIPVLGKKLHKTKFEVITITGDRLGAGTDANVFVTVFGTRGRTDKLPLRSKTVDTFERGQSDVFVIEGVTIGEMKKIRIEQDGRGRGSDWFLERVVVTDQTRPFEKYYFVCNSWLNDKEGMSRDLLGTTDPNLAAALTDYKITVKTGDFRKAGTDADVYVTIFGDFGDTGTKYLDNKMENNFERNKEDVFSLKIPSVGNIAKLRVGHNNKGPSPGWFLDSINVEAEGRTCAFICQRWLSKDEDDGRIERDLLLDGKESIFIHNVTVYTGEKRGAGTNAKVWIELFDENDTSSARNILRGGSFEQGDVDQFPLELTSLYAPVDHIYIGHDDSGVGSDWLLDRVVISTPAAGIEQTFDCQDWIRRSSTSSAMKKLTENRSKRKSISSSEGWICQILTSNIRGAGTNANVFVQIYDVKGVRSDEIALDNKSDNFEQGQTDRFTLSLPQNMEHLYKMRIWHDGSRPFAGWHLDKISITNPVSGEVYTFICNNWLATNEGDGEIIREIPATSDVTKSPGVLTDYSMMIKTGDAFGSGTDANVFINLFGSKGDTGPRPLQKSNNRNKFERNNMDEFTLQAVDLGDIDHIQIGHDNWGGNAGWFLDSVTVKNQLNLQAITFPCERWLDYKQDDGKIVRDLYLDGDEMLNTTRYTVRVKTGDKIGAGTNANVFIQLFGEKGSSESTMLKQNENNIRNKFERNQVDIFHIETGDVGHVERIKLGHDGSGVKDGWYVESVEIEVPSNGQYYLFGINRWFASDEDDGLIVRELYPSKVENRDGTVPYQIEVFTGDERFAGTDAKVFIQIYGLEVKTEQKNLNDRSDNFERGKVDQFKLEDVDVGEIQKIRIGHDDTNLGSGWFLHKVIISKRNDKNQTEKYYFTANRWLDSKKDDKAIIREFLAEDENGNPISKLNEVEYEIITLTGTVRGAGTDANIFITLNGENGDTGERALNESERFNLFESGNEDTFKIKSIELGQLKSVKIRHDGTGLRSGWYLEHIRVASSVLKEPMIFPCKKWLAKDEDDGQIQRSLMGVPASQWQRRDSIGLEQKAAGETYNIKVHTGDVRGAGTDANVYMQLFGTNDDTGVIQLKTSNNRNKWERNQIDEFSFDFIGLGNDVKKLRLGHDNKGLKSGWYVADVNIDCPSLGKSWRFPIGLWFATDEGDQLIERDVYPDLDDNDHYEALIPYEVTIVTSDIRSAGTNSDVHVMLFGTDGTSSDKLYLCPERAKRRNHFGRGKEDSFVVQSPDVGEIEKIRIGHDDTGIGSGWHLAKVSIRTLNDPNDPTSGSVAIDFPCGRWLADDEGDRCTTVDLLPVGAEIQNRHYTVHVITGDKLGAGTDANIFLTMTGENGDSPEIPLKDSETNRNKFERDQTDIFKIVNPELGKIFKIKLRSDYSGLMNAKWFCSEVKVITDDPTDEPVVFYAERWFSKEGNRGKSNGKLERTFYCQGYDPEKMTSKSNLSTCSAGSWKSRSSAILDGPVTKYEVRIKTGEESGAASSTEPDAYIKFNGTELSTKRINLVLPENEDRFEKGGINEFVFENLDVDQLTSIEVGSRNTEEEWLIKNVDITLPLKGQHHVFEINNWIGRSKDAGLLNRVIDIGDAMSMGSIKTKTSYEITVLTGNAAGSGLDEGDLYLSFNGETKTISDMKLTREESSFGRGGRDIFDLDMENVEPLKSITARVQANNASEWMCDQIQVRNVEVGTVYIFHAGEWIHGNDSIELTAANENIKKVNYRIEVKTSDKFGGGTDANVKIKLTGVNGESSEWKLTKSETFSDPFEKGNTDIFTFNDKIDLGDLYVCRVEHDNSGLKSGWHLEHINVAQNDKNWVFPCNQWLAKTEGDRQIMRELKVSKISQKVSNRTDYKIKIYSGDVKNGGTNQDFQIKLNGENGKTTNLTLCNTVGLRMASSAEFLVDNAVNVGIVKEIGLSLPPSKTAPRQSTSNTFNTRFTTIEENRAYITIVEISGDNNKYKAELDTWIESDEVMVPVSIESGQALQSQRQNLKYKIMVVTSDEKSAGTDANVKMTIYGALGDSGKRPLEKRWRNLFERGQTDDFEIECIDLGELDRIRLEHDNKMISPDWKPQKVIISVGNNEWLFPCGQWIGNKKGKGLEAEFRVFNSGGQSLPEHKKKKKGLFGLRT